MYIVSHPGGKDEINHVYAQERDFTNRLVLPSGVTVLYRNDLPDDIRAFGQLMANDLPKIAAEYAAEGMKSPIKLTPAEYAAETERLAAIAETCLHEGFDWDGLLPLTKSGRLPKDRKISVAASKCVYVDANKATTGYFSGERLQLMLVPVWPNTNAFIHDETMPNVAALVLEDGPISSKTPPIFDDDGNASKPVTARSKYLRDDAVMAGSVYLSGKTELLYLGRITHPDENQCFDQMSRRHFSHVSYVYVRYTKEVQAAVANCRTQSELYEAVNRLANTKDKYMHELCNVTKTPKKFTELVTALVAPFAVGRGGHHEFWTHEFDGPERRTWFIDFNDPHIDDGRYFM